MQKKLSGLRAIWKPTHVAQLFVGPVLWAIWFVALYGGFSVACALVPPPPSQGALSWLNGGLLAATLGTVAVLMWWSLRCWRAGTSQVEGTDRFVARVGAAVHLFSAGATLIIGLPVIALPPCV